MNKVTLNSLFLSITVLLISTIGGALIAQKLAEGNAGFSFLRFGCSTALLILILQLTTFSPAKQKFFSAIIFRIFWPFDGMVYVISISTNILD